MGLRGGSRAGPRPGLGVGSEDLERRRGRGGESVDSHSVLSTVSVVAQPCEEPSGEERGLQLRPQGLGNGMLGDARRPAFRIVGSPKESLYSPGPRRDPLSEERRWRVLSEPSRAGHVSVLCRFNSRDCTWRLHSTGEARQLGALRRPGAWVGGRHTFSTSPILSSAETKKKSNFLDVS